MRVIVSLCGGSFTSLGLYPQFPCFHKQTDSFSMIEFERVFCAGLSTTHCNAALVVPSTPPDIHLVVSLEQHILGLLSGLIFEIFSHFFIAVSPLSSQKSIEFHLICTLAAKFVHCPSHFKQKTSCGLG